MTVHTIAVRTSQDRFEDVVMPPEFEAEIFRLEEAMNPILGLIADPHGPYGSYAGLVLPIASWRPSRTRSCAPSPSSEQGGAAAAAAAHAWGTPGPVPTPGLSVDPGHAAE